MPDIFSNMPIPYSTPTQAKETTATQTTQPVVVKEAIPSSKVQEQQADSVEISAGSVINFAKQKAANSAAKKAGDETVKVVRKIPNKALAVIVAGIALAANIWTASLNATEKSSNIDHRWTGHKQ